MTSFCTEVPGIFPGGGPTLGAGYDLSKFSQKLLEIEKNLVTKGPGAGGAPLDPPLAMASFLKDIYKGIRVFHKNSTDDIPVSTRMRASPKVMILLKVLCRSQKVQKKLSKFYMKHSLME